MRHDTSYAPEAPIEGVLADDPELFLAWGPLAADMGTCQYDACESDEACTCQEPVG